MLSLDPFARLNKLLEGVTPDQTRVPILMHLGEPQHAPPAMIAEVVAANAHLWNRYPPSQGLPEYRDACARWLTRRYALPPGAITGNLNVLALSGTKEGLFLVTQALNSAVVGRSVVVLPNPYYLVYDGAAETAGYERVYLDATAENGFLPDIDHLDSSVLDKTAFLYLCNPSNPQGTVADCQYLERAIALARRHGFVLIVDECYADIYNTAPPSGALEACFQLGGGFDNVLVFHSCSKRSSAGGLRCGFVAGDPALIATFLRLRRFGGSQVPMPLQYAAAALWDDETHASENRLKYRIKFDIAETILRGHFDFYRPAAGFFLWLNVGDSASACVRLWREVALRVLPGAYIAQPGNAGRNPAHHYIRVALVHEPHLIADGLERLVQALGRSS
jgi:aspartate/methionine/tyrosine aminotransferase